MADRRGNRFIPWYQIPHMVTTTERDDMTWFECEACGLLFDDQDDARKHEQNCDAEGPSYLQ